MVTPLTSRKRSDIILFLAPLIFIFALALDIYVPSIPVIQQEFHANQDVMQLTISLFLLVTGFGQLLAGPISDQVGRRKVALISSLIFTIGSIVCAASQNITILIAARVLQGVGACGMFVSAFAMVRDLFSGDECATVYSFLNSTISLSPLFAPIIGGYLEYWISWRASFVFLAVVGTLLVLQIYKYITETLAPENKKSFTKAVFIDYFKIIKSRAFLPYTFCASAAFACFLTFFSSSSYIIIDLLHKPEEHFGFYFASMGIVFFIASIFSGYSAKYLGTYLTVLIGTFLILLSGIMMTYWYYHYGLSITEFIAPMIIMNWGGAMAMGGSAGGAIEPFPEMAGTAAALFGSCQFVFAFLVSQFVLYWQVTSTMPLAITLIVLGFLSFVTILFSHGLKK